MNLIQLIFVINIGLIASILNVLHIIIGYARTLPGQVYLATGHYYLDYFEYLQALSQGWHGQWMYSNIYATDVKTKTFFGMWQYVIFGQAGRFFGLSQIATYWLTTILLSIILSVLIFLIIRKLLYDKPFYWQLAAYILTIFAAPFFRIVNQNGYLTTVAYRFWNDKAVLVDRFGGILYHITDQIVIILVLILISNSLDKLSLLSKKSIIVRIIIIIFLLTFLLSFSPAYFLLVVGALSLTLVWTFFYKKSLKKISFLGIILLILLPIGYLIRNYFIHQFYSGVTQTETVWQVHPPLIDVILTIGPILLFIWLGIKNYFRSLTTLRLIFLNLVFVSYLVFFTPLALFLGTTNTRFLIPINYILFAVLSVVGIKRLKSLIVVTTIVFLLFIPANIEAIVGQTTNKNLISQISYLPKGIVDGFKFLVKFPGQGAVLTTPAQFLGAIIPIYSGKPVYLERPGQPKYDDKVNLSAHFYLGLMEEKVAKEFLKKNKIEFIVLTSVEGYPLEPLAKYTFLKSVYRNKDIVIFQKF